MKYIFYVNVGNMPKEKAKEYCDSMKEFVLAEKFLNSFDKIMMVAVRGDQPTKLEPLPE